MMAKVVFEDKSLKKGQPVLVRNCQGEDWHPAIFVLKILDEHGESVYVVNEQGRNESTGWKMCRSVDS